MAFFTGLKSWKIAFSMCQMKQIDFPERAKTASGFKNLQKDLAR